MDDYRWNYQVPAFGSWDYNGNGDSMPYTQCFETARQASGLGRHGNYNPQDYADHKDLYVAGDLYQNDVVTPAVIVVARRRRKGGYSNGKGGRKHDKEEEMKKQEHKWRGYEYSAYDRKEPPSPVACPPKPSAYNHKSKAVDEDLYKIPAEFLHVKPKKKKGFGLFSSCLQPACA